MKHKWMQTREKKHKEYQRITCIKKIALQQQCSVLLNYWLTLKFNWTKLQHNLLQLDTMSLGENFSDLIYWILSITTLSTWEFCNSECLWKRPQIQVWPPPPPWRILCLQVQKLPPTRSFVSHSLILYLCNCLQQQRHEKWVHRLAPIKSL